MKSGLLCCYIVIGNMAFEMDQLKGTVEGLFSNIHRGGLVKSGPTTRIRYRSGRASHLRITTGQP